MGRRGEAHVKGTGFGTFIASGRDRGGGGFERKRQAQGWGDSRVKALKKVIWEIFWKNFKKGNFAISLDPPFDGTAPGVRGPGRIIEPNDWYMIIIHWDQEDGYAGLYILEYTVEESC